MATAAKKPPPRKRTAAKKTTATKKETSSTASATSAKSARTRSSSTAKPATRKRSTKSSGSSRPAAISALSPSERKIHALIYGDPGSEKTRLAGSSPNGLLLNADGASGPDSILRSGMQVWHLDDLYEAQTAYEWLLHEGHKEFDWVWLDSITLLQEKQMDKVLGDVVKAKPHRDPDIPDVQEYLKVQNQIKRLVRDLIGLDMNVGITAHVLRVEDDDDGAVAYWPAITGKLMPQKICGYMGIVGYMGRQKVKVKGKDETKEVTTLRTQRSEKFYAKDRYGALNGQPMPEPSIPKLIKKVNDAVSGGEE